MAEGGGDGPGGNPNPWWNTPEGSGYIFSKVLTYLVVKS